MCFYIHPKHKKVKIATENIVCYKRLEIDKVDVVSPYQFLVYFKKGTKNKKTTKTVKNFSWGEYKESINRGLHSYSNLRTARVTSFYTCVYKAIIPKGTKYYYNPEGHEYVSKKLIVYNEQI